MKHTGTWCCSLLIAVNDVRPLNPVSEPRDVDGFDFISLFYHVYTLPSRSAIIARLKEWKMGKILGQSTARPQGSKKGGIRQREIIEGAG